MKVRPATKDDVAEMSRFLRQLAALGKRTSRSDPDYVLAHYIEDPDRVHCVVAEDADGRILGFQSLRIATEGNAYGVTVGWGVIGTHVRPDAARRGVGQTLFAATREAARKAELKKIDATIAVTNTEGLAYYEAMGFRTYRTPDGAVCKCYDVT